jgi:Fe-S-cluster containining protein
MEGARFACQGSGACCSGYTYGPVEDAVVDAVRAHTFRGNAALIAAADPFRQVAGMRVLRTVAARCVFLSPERRCLIHEEIGAHAKPAVCRAYPFTFAAAPDGDCFVALNMECSGHADARRCGPPLSERLPELAALARDLPGLRAVPDPVPLSTGRAVPYARFVRLDDRWMAGLRGRDEPLWGHVRTMSRALVAFERGVDDPASLPLHPRGTPCPGRAGEAPLVDAARALLALCRAWMLEEQAAGNPDQAELCARLLVALTLVVGERPASTSTRALLDRAAALRAAPGALDEPEVHRLFLDQLENLVFGKQLHAPGPVKTALGLEIVKLAAAEALAAVHAALVGADRIGVDHANEAIRVVNRVVRRPILEVALADRAALGEAVVDAAGAPLGEAP